MPFGAWASRILKNSDVVVAVAVIGMVAMMVIPLPAMVMDLLLSLNLTVAMVVLLVTMYTLEPLQFSVFPSLLLVTTLFRLALNVSSTRLILLHGYAGEVIGRFGEFVVGGNPVVGFIVFCILAIIQFIVITRGAERVAEVAARFTLDAMPGKQMSIDADLNAGIITEDQARTRRRDVEREADFYGAMDGAAKFVKGDAIAAVIIIVINLLGGFAVGILQRGLSLNEALRQYALLTVGDGLVTQIPALLISTATGIVVTRAASESDMGSEIVRQVLAQPRVLGIAAVMLGALGLVPGLPHLPFLVLAAATGALAWGLRQSARGAEKARADQALRDERERQRQPENVFALLQVDPLEVELGYGLIGLAGGGGHDGELLDRVVLIRRQMAAELGLVIPPVRIRDNMNLGPNAYVIKLKGVKVGGGELYLDHVLAMGGAPGSSPARELEGIPTREPAFGMEACWITPEGRAAGEESGYTVVDAPSVLATHLGEVIRANAAELLGRQEVRRMLDAVKEFAPAVVEDLVPEALTLGEVQKVLQNLLREGVAVRDTVTILEALGDRARQVRDTDILTEYARSALGRQITARYCGDERRIRAITLAPALEEEILRASQEGGSMAALGPETLERLLNSLRDEMQRLVGAGEEPVVLCSAGVRPLFRRLVSRIAPRLAVLSYSELDPMVRVESVGVVGVDAAA